MCLLAVMMHLFVFVNKLKKKRVPSFYHFDSSTPRKYNYVFKLVIHRSGTPVENQRKMFLKNPATRLHI